MPMGYIPGFGPVRDEDIHLVADRRFGPGPQDIGPNYVDPGRGHPTVYSQLPRHGWVDKEDDPWSAALGKPGTTTLTGAETGRPRGPAGGRHGGAYSSVLPDWAQGIALPGKSTLGKWYKLTGPTGQSLTVQQTDIGPLSRSRPIDMSAAVAHQLGAKPVNEIPGQFTWQPTDPPPEARDISDPVLQGIAVARARGMADPDLHRQQMAEQRGQVLHTQVAKDTPHTVPSGGGMVGFTGAAPAPGGMKLNERQRREHGMDPQSNSHMLDTTRQTGRVDAEIPRHDAAAPAPPPADAPQPMAPSRWHRSAQPISFQGDDGAAFKSLRDYHSSLEQPVRTNTAAPMPHLRERMDNIHKHRQQRVEHDDKNKMARERHGGTVGGFG